jgi:hypothetical protein
VFGFLSLATLKTARGPDFLPRTPCFLPPPPTLLFFRSHPRRLLTSTTQTILKIQDMPRKTLPSFAFVVSSARHESFDLPDYYRPTRHEQYGPYYKEQQGSAQDSMVC